MGTKKPRKGGAWAWVRWWEWRIVSVTNDAVQWLRAVS